MIFELNSRKYSTRVWSRKDGKIGELLAVDTETEEIQEGLVPAFIIGQAYAGQETVYFLTLSRLKEFLEVHADATLLMHNAAFDIAVIGAAVGYSFDAQVRGQQLYDTGLLYQLIGLATEGQVPRRWSLDLVCQELLGLRIDKNAAIRCGFGKYRRGDQIDFQGMPETDLRYAAIDAIVTYDIYVKLRAKLRDLGAKHDLSHKIALMGAIGLDRVSRLGIGFDVARKEQFLLSIEQEIAKNRATLECYGYRPGQEGNTREYVRIIGELGINLPRTETGKVSAKAEHLEEHRSVPFVDALLHYKEDEKLKSFVAKLSQNRIHTRFRVLLNSGRASSSGPNIQNLPRAPGIRECFVPAPGHHFLIIDYSTLELCTLAQVCYDLYGFSRMRDLINEGTDLHRWLAATILGIPEKDVTAEQRQAAKAANFGFPGGLGLKTFVDYASKTYGVSEMDEEKARHLKDQWLEAFPEMKTYMKDHLLNRHDFNSLEWCNDPDIACAIFKRIVGGEMISKAGIPYAESTIRWALDTVVSDLAPGLAGAAQGSQELKQEVLREPVTVRTGRVRGRATYCQVRNIPFQGLAADGAKIALYRLTQAGYRVVNFIHDEFIIEVPIQEDYRDTGAAVEKIVIEAMKAVVPDVTIRTEWAVTDRWYKKHKQVVTATGGVGVFRIPGMAVEAAAVELTTMNPEILPATETAGSL